MPSSQLLFLVYAALVAAAPTPARVERQLSGLSGLPLPTASLPGFPIPSGDIPSLTGTGSGFSMPTGLPTGLSGSGGLLSGLSGLTGGSSSGLMSGLSGLTGGSSSGLMSGLSGLSGGSSSGLMSGSSTTGSVSDASDSSTTDASSAASGGCQPVTLIFARGTTEMGTLGTVVGPGLSSDSESALSNKVTVTGVDYAASAAGIATEAMGSGGAGTQAMVADVTAALSSCPDTQIVLSGYSQGAMLVHNTMKSLDATAAASVKAAVTFGDPFVGQMPDQLAEGTFKSFCASSDSVCAAGNGMSPSAGGTDSGSASGHLGYGADTEAAATFIKGMVTV